MTSVLGAEDVFQIYLLAGIVLGMVLAAKCLIQMACPRMRTPGGVELVCGVLACAFSFLLCLDAFLHGGILVAVAAPLRSLVVIGTSATLVAAHLGVSLLRIRCRQLALQPVAWLAVALTLAATVWSSHRHSVGNLRIEIDSAYAQFEGELTPIRDLVAVTDRGREISLYRLDPQDSNSGTSPTPPAEPENCRANCHGWVFASGQHLLWRDGVERILEDNGYQNCSDPRPGDLIIYRNQDGEIVHTGLVKADVFGELLIESKWGVGKVLVHSPEMQPYGNDYSYYRSSRQGHTLTIRAALPTMSIASR